VTFAYFNSRDNAQIAARLAAEISDVPPNWAYLKAGFNRKVN
jgi:hypothetical protein